MKFDFAIGNPAYQDETTGENKEFAPPIYHKFLDSAYEIADKVEMVHPARFLFNAGRTPKAWNEKMLNDPHVKVSMYEPDATKLFANTDIKGGVAITYRDTTKDFGTIGTFTAYPELNSIIKKTTGTESLMDIIFIQNRFDLDALYGDHPECKSSIGSNGKDSRFEKNIFEKIPLFTKTKKADDIETTGIFNGKRTRRFIPQKYVDMKHENIEKHKVIVPVANGTGKFGEPLGGLEILGPHMAYTRSFVGIGKADSESEAKAILSYLKTKFARTMLAVLKVTQMNNRDVWQYVPLQDFTDKSDINWKTSIKNIDRQLYKKYNLTDEEIDFIETHIKEME